MRILVGVGIGVVVVCVIAFGCWVGEQIEQADKRRARRR